MNQPAARGSAKMSGAVSGFIERRNTRLIDSAWSDQRSASKFFTIASAVAVLYFSNVTIGLLFNSDKLTTQESRVELYNNYCSSTSYGNMQYFHRIVAGNVP